MDLLFMIILLPIFLIGCLVHGPMILAVKLFVKKGISSHEFKAPVFLSVVIVFYLLVSFVTILMTIFINLKVLMVVLGLFLFGSLSILYYRAYFSKWKYLFSSSTKKMNYHNAMKAYEMILT
jgi:hypothetical protein